MATKKMTRVNFEKTIGGIREFDETLASAGNGDPVFVPRGVQTVFVSILPTFGEGKIQYTNDNVAAVKSDTAVWRDWAKGSVYAYADDCLFPCTAIRQVNISGTTRFFGGAR